MAGKTHRVIIVGAGFAGLACARSLARRRSLDVLLIDRRNYHLFQPLLYQVAMAGLSPAEIAVPIRSLLSNERNVRVLKAEVESLDLEARQVTTSRGRYGYDFLVVATGAMHTYFGHDEWENVAPGLKTLEQATEIRRRVLDAFEMAESESDPEQRRAWLTFVVVGGGATGVELAGAIGEMSRFTLAKDFRNIDPTLTRVVLIEAGERILPSFSPASSRRATRDLERLGVQVWTQARVDQLDDSGVHVGGDTLRTKTVLWAAGVAASGLGAQLGADLDKNGRVLVRSDLSLRDHPEVFVAGDLCHCVQPGREAPLPGVATVALQQGRYLAETIERARQGRETRPFDYVDKGQLATIGRSRALLEKGPLRLSGLLAWCVWLVVHIYYLSGFKNRILVLLQWAWSYLSFARGARLIVGKSWRSYAPPLPAGSRASTGRALTTEPPPGRERRASG